VFKFNSDLYLDEVFYQTGLTNSDIATKLRNAGITKQMRIVADSAEPKSIEDLDRYGFNIEGANKGNDSIRNSIDTLKQFKVYITRRSVNVIKEKNLYRWSKKNPSEPEDNNNHSIDAIRYVALNRINKNSGKYSMI
jgi:phage terminase large subunit